MPNELGSRWTYFFNAWAFVKDVTRQDVLSNFKSWSINEYRFANDMGKVKVMTAFLLNENERLHFTCNNVC